MGCLFSKPRHSELQNGLTDEPQTSPVSNPPKPQQNQSVVTNSQPSPPPSTPPAPQPAPVPQPVPAQQNPPQPAPPQQTTPAPMVPQTQDGPTISKDTESEAFGLLLCGTGESGKTTFTRQLRIKHLSGLPIDEKKSFVSVIRGNLIETIQELIVWLEHHSIAIETDLEDLANMLINTDAFDCDFNEEQVDALRQLWADSSIQQAFKHREETTAPDHMDYFFNKLDEIAESDYTPTDEDIIKARIRTVGINAITFDIDGALIRIYDVGGQKNERAKWNKAKSEVSGIMFCVSLPEFDRLMFEETKNRMDDSLEMFEAMITSFDFKDDPFFLIFNKYDAFEKKIKETDRFAQRYQNYSGDPHNPEECFEYIQNMFIQKAGVVKTRPILTFKLSALDQEQVNSVTDQICKFIRENYFKEYSDDEE